MNTRYAIFDLDNCLSDDEPRIGKIDWRKQGAERYHAYHQLCGLDKPAEDARKIVEEAIWRGLKIVFFTGRPENVRGQTLSWIQKNLGVTPYALLMRPTEDDPRHAAELKRWMLEDFCLGEQTGPHAIVEAWDDRHDVLAMYRDRGIKAIHKQIHSLSAYSYKEERSHGEAQLREMAQRMADEHPNTTVTLRGEVIPPSPGSEVGPEADRPLKWLKGYPDNVDLDSLDAVHAALEGRILTSDEAVRAAGPNAADILSAAAATFRERNAVYGSNYLMIKKLVDVLFPQGVPSALVHTDRWHLFELMLVKLSRFAISSLTHQDSIRDLTVYGAMVEAALPKEGEQ